jgi:CBS domain-containing protein
MRAGVSVAQVARDQVVAVRERARFSEIVAAMRRFHISALPVIDSEDRVIGLISNYDLLSGDEAHGLAKGGGLLRRLLRGAARSDVEGKFATELMTSPAVTVTATTSACEAARQMYRCGIHQLPVVDPATGRLTGIVTRSDLLAVYERADEDIRREILDDVITGTLRMDPELIEVTVLDGTVTVRGTLARRSVALRLTDAIAHVGGVITVIDHLAYERDDTAKPSRARP